MSTATQRLQATSRLLRAVLHSTHPAVQQLVRAACPDFHEVRAVMELCDRLEATALDTSAKARRAA